MDANNGLIDVGHAVDEVRDYVSKMCWRGVADRVGDVDGCGAGGDGGFDDLAQKVDFGAGCVFGRKLDVVAVRFGTRDALDGATDDFFFVHFELEFAMDGARGEKDVNPHIVAVLQRFPRAVDIARVAAGQSADRRSRNGRGNFSHRLKIADRSDRKSGFDHVDSQLGQFLCHLQLFVEVHAATGRLLAVTQGGVEDGDLSRLFGCGHGNYSVLVFASWRQVVTND